MAQISNMKARPVKTSTGLHLLQESLAVLFGSTKLRWPLSPQVWASTLSVFFLEGEVELKVVHVSWQVNQTVN